MAAASCGVRSRRVRGSGRRLVVANFGGVIGEAKRAALYEPFFLETGIEVIAAPGLDLAKIRLQAQSGDVAWDVVDLLPAWLPPAIRLGALAPIDPGVVRRAGCIPQAYSPYAVGASVYTSGIGFTGRPAATEPPRTWPEFWDVRGRPGRRTLVRRVTDLIEIALMADGVPASRIYPCDVERAFRSLDRIKPAVNHWVQFAEQTVSLIRQDETDFSQTYSSRVRALAAAGAPIGFSFEQNLMGVLWTAAMKGAPDPEAAMRFCAFAADPARQVALSELTGDAPVYPQAVARVDPAVRPWLPRIDHPDNLFTDPFWWDGRLEALTLRFQDWLFR